MKTFLSLIVLALFTSCLIAQPCKSVKQGMSKAEVLKLVGNPTEIDTLGFNTQADGKKILMVVWQYGDVMKDGNQRVEFSGDKVDKVTADGKKLDELMMAFKHGDVPKEELKARIEKINIEGCK